LVVGRFSNRDAVGAEVTLVAGGVTQRRLVRTGSSYCSQSMTALHFGLGTATQVDSLEIRWPSGRVERRERLSVDQRITVFEGQKWADFVPGETPVSSPRPLSRRIAGE
jgi:hypothetical protein